MLTARLVQIESLDEATAHARRVGLAEESARQAAKGLGRPAQLVLTGLPAGVADRLRRAGEGGPVVLTGGGDAAFVSGTRWSLFSFATALAGEPDLEPVARALTTALSRSDRAPLPLRLGKKVLQFGRRTHLMGVVNVTPDSFSDGGLWLDPGRAVAHGEALARAGAAVLDVGGESTRPGAPPVPAEEELRRILPVVRGLVAAGQLVSVDTTKAEVARAALEAGAVMVNDVSGLSADPALGRVVAEAGAALVLMHMRATPAEMQSHTDYGDLMGELVAELAGALARAAEAGVAEDRLVVDPGIGFAKTAEQNLVILRRLRALSVFGRPVLVGPSRKSFIGHLTGAGPEDRLPGTLAAVTAAALAGAHLLRVHDVAEAKQCLQVADAIRTASAEGREFDVGARFWEPVDPRVR